MSNRRIERLAMSAAALLLACGLVRSLAKAGEPSPPARTKMIADACAAERKRLAITSKVELYKRYPTPEIQLSRRPRVAPGSTTEIVISGKFLPGTMFLPYYRDVEVVKESVTASEYRGAIRVPAGLEIGYIIGALRAPVSCASALFDIDIVSKEGEFTSSPEPVEAEQGAPAPEKPWRVKLALEELAQTTENRDIATYAIQLYRQGQPQPFKTGTVSFERPRLYIDTAERRSLGRIKGMDEEALGCWQLDLQFKAGQVEGRLNCSNEAIGSRLVAGSFKPF